MKPTALFLTLYLVTGALGRNLAGGFERMWFWYAYQIDIAVFGQGKNFIAKGCEGKGEGGSCTFNEFIKHINNLDKVPSISDDQNPDVEATAKWLNDNGFTGDYDLQKIYPNAGVSGIPTLFEKVGEAVAASKEALGSDLSSISTLLDKVDEASLGVSDLRNADFDSHLAIELAPKARQKGFQIETKTVSVYGETFTEMNIRGTIAAYPRVANINGLISSWTSKYKSSTMAGNSHWSIIKKLKAARIVQKRGC